MPDQKREPEYAQYADHENLTTVSHPERPAYVLIYGLLGWSALLVALSLVLVPEEVTAVSVILMCAVLGTALILCIGFTRLCVVHLRATPWDGLEVSLGHFVSRRLPWEAISSVQKAPTGGAIDVGWKWMGPGRIGYLAGAENILVKTAPEFREKALHGEVELEGRQKLSEWYYISVPDAEEVARQLTQMRAQALSQQ